MKINTIALVLGMSMAVFTGSALAVGDATLATDSTHVYFDGTITNAPCSIPNASRDQHVKMGSIAAHVLKNGGTSDAQPFHFDLTDCPAGSSVTVTFGGATDPKAASLLSLGSGQASGAGIQILADGAPVKLDEATEKQNLSEGDNTLTFSAQLKGDGASISTGDFAAVSNVTFTYQ
ncbi:fimbrial protein [Pantoea sp. SIMBA_072]